MTTLEQLFQREATKLESSIEAQGGWDVIGIQDWLARWEPVLKGHKFPEKMGTTRKVIQFSNPDVDTP